VASDAAGLADADVEVKKLDQRLAAGVRPAPIDEAARVRARCLDVLTRARRASGDDAGQSDALLSELSAAGGWDPVRDERGVVVTLHGAFRGPELAGEVTAKLKDLGRIAAAHPAFGVQVVVHDAQVSSPKDPADTHRAEAAVQALVAGGEPTARIQPEQAGTHAPLVDPADGKERARNERLDVVFVASGK
jgi:outer membrane protein OmpA-like peptidoglycan-associated protein